MSRAKPFNNWHKTGSQTQIARSNASYAQEEMKRKESEYLKFSIDEFIASGGVITKVPEHASNGGPPLRCKTKKCGRGVSWNVWGGRREKYERND